MSIDRGLDSEDVIYIYTMEYYSAIKKNDIMPFAATWMELENLIMSEMRQKDIHSFFSLILLHHK